MALLEHIETGKATMLRAQHIVGRNPFTSHTVIEAEDVSRSHATIYWSQSKWLIQDHSRNGTLVDGQLLRNTTAVLAMGSILQFGNQEYGKWRLTDTAPPCSFIHSLTDPHKMLLLDSCLALPDEQQPEAHFYMAPDQRWHFETATGVTPLTNGAQFAIAAEQWAFVENECLQETIDHGRVLENAHFAFYLSPDEEDLRLGLFADNNLYDLGRRSHNFMLLTLARKRLADNAQGLAAADQGWMAVDDLEREVGKEIQRDIDAYYLNVQVFRLRKQLLELRLIGHLFADLIERRPGEMRFAFPRFKIIKEDQVIGELTWPTNTTLADTSRTLPSHS